jgi:transposase IS66 family protein
LALLRPYYTHQVLELPPIAMDVTHWGLYQGWCLDCGHWSKAQVPAEHATGYGPRCSALMGEVAGTYGNGRHIVQTFCASVLRVPISLGAIQKVPDRETQAIEPYYAAIATQARQTCLAHLIRSARGVASRDNPDLAACGTWALAELQRLCHMATAPPTGGEWRAWYARLCKLIDQYHERQDDAGKFVRRLLREMDSLWVFLAHHGVAPTNNRAERALRCGVLWRKRSQGIASGKGNRWVERILSLKETCRLQARSTYTMLVEAVTGFFHGHQPDLSWIN